MTLGTKSAVVRALYEHIQRNDTDGLDELVAATHSDHSNDRNGPDGFARAIVALHSAYEDFCIEIKSIVEEGDLVVVQWRETGVHVGPFFNLRPTGRPFESTGLNMYRVIDDLIVDSWIAIDPKTIRGQQAAQAELALGTTAR